MTSPIVPAARLDAVAVVGAGTMGRGIAQVFAQAGFTVALIDSTASALGRAQDAIAGSLSRFVDRGTLDPSARDAALGRIHAGMHLEVVSDATLVVEAIVEDARAKRSLFAQLDSLAPPAALFASNTSSISIGSLAAATCRADRVVGLHFMNPAPLMTLVEVVRGVETSDATMTTAREIVARLGKLAVEAADVPGFIANRVLMPMINEAAYALMQGVGTRDAIDTVMRDGMRHPMGPLALADLIGLDVCVAILGVMRDGLDDGKYAPCPLLEQLVAEGRLGRKSGGGFYDYSAPAAGR